MIAGSIFRLLAILAASTPALSIQAASATGVIVGVVSRLEEGSPLAGATVVVTDAKHVVARRTSESDGSFSVNGLPPGTYSVSASLREFVTTGVRVLVTAGETSRVAVELPAAVEHIHIVAASEVLTAGDTLAPVEMMASRELDQFVPGTGFQSAVRQFASLMATQNGVNIKGGRPDQAGVQLGAATLVDPASAIAHIPLPDDAIESVTVIPNPYDVEYGRFSSGLVVIQSARASDLWRFQVNRLSPMIQNKRGEAFRFRISDFRPRYVVGGPILKDRLFLEETGQVRYATADVPSRPESELRVSKSFSSFSRVDAILSASHSLVGTVGFFPGATTAATLGTFTPPAATVDLHALATHAAITDRMRWSNGAVNEVMAQVLKSRTDADAQGTAAMTLEPETTVGNFFNRQHRDSTTVQLSDIVTIPRESSWGRHLFKVGVDVLAAAYDGTSDSHPVLIERIDRTLARRLDYAGVSRQSAHGTDVAMFAHDRLDLSNRWSVEIGGRIDRDAIVDRLNVTPRIGTAVQLTASGSTVLRSGIGLFHGRTPSTVSAFESFTSAVDTRFSMDGVTLLVSPLRVTPVTRPNLETARSRTWDVGVQYRLNSHWELHTTVLARDGRGEFIVVPNLIASRVEMQLSSDGRSSYRDLEFGAHFTRGATLDVEALYDWSAARGDLNTLTSLFDTVMAPVIGANAYAALNGDVPHRLFVRGRSLPTAQWLLLGVVDWRTGLPYSTVNDTLDFVGARNDHRFPNYARLELGLERRVDIRKWRFWVGVRATNVFDAFLPTDVQTNTSSPLFGRFYNSEDRHFGLHVRLGS